MKLNSKNKKKQNAIRKALLLGLPIASLMTGGCGKATADNGTPNGNEPEKQNVTEKETFSIDTMSLINSRFTTPGLSIPPPMMVEAQEYEVREGDSWESLGKKFGLEILLRINGIPTEKTWDILDSGKVPDDLKLVPGQEIFVPVNIFTGRYEDLYGSDGEYCP